MTEPMSRGQVAALIRRDRRRVPEWAAREGIPRRRDAAGWWVYPADLVRVAAEPIVRVWPELRLARFIRNPLNRSTP